MIIIASESDSSIDFGNKNLKEPQKQLFMILIFTIYNFNGKEKT